MKQDSERRVLAYCRIKHKYKHTTNKQTCILLRINYAI